MTFEQFFKDVEYPLELINELDERIEMCRQALLHGGNVEGIRNGESFLLIPSKSQTSAKVIGCSDVAEITL